MEKNRNDIEETVLACLSLSLLESRTDQTYLWISEAEWRSQAEIQVISKQIGGSDMFYGYDIKIEVDLGRHYFPSIVYCIQFVVWICKYELLSCCLYALNAFFR